MNFSQRAVLSSRQGPESSVSAGDRVAHVLNVASALTAAVVERVVSLSPVERDHRYVPVRGNPHGMDEVRSESYLRWRWRLPKSGGTSAS